MANSVLEAGKIGLEKGSALGFSFWSGVATGMGDESTVCVCLYVCACVPIAL